MSDNITLTGLVGTEPRVFTSPTGLAVTSFRLATSQRVRDRVTGTWRDLGSNWYSVSSFRSLAEHVAQSVHKGDRVIVTGRLRVTSWSNGGREGTNIEVEADAIGHDLGWGSSTFVRAERSTPVREANSDELAVPSQGFTDPHAGSSPGECSVGSALRAA